MVQADTAGEMVAGVTCLWLNLRIDIGPGKLLVRVLERDSAKSVVELKGKGTEGRGVSNGVCGRDKNAKEELVREVTVFWDETDMRGSD